MNPAPSQQEKLKIPLLVLLPGLDGTGRLFREFAARVGVEFDTLVVQYPTDMVEDYDVLAARIVQQLPRNRVLALLGESYAGPLAVKLVAEQNLEIVAMILAGSFATSPRSRIESRLGIILARYLAGPFRAVYLFGHFILRCLGLRSLSAEQFHPIAAVQPRVFAGRIRSVLYVDVRTELAQTTMPLLYLQGIYDWVVPRRSYTEIRELRPDCELATFDCGHMILQSKPQEAAQVVGEFLRRRCAERTAVQAVEPGS